MKILETLDLAIPGVKLIAFARFPDERGYFTETFRREEIAVAIGAPALEIVQVNESLSRAGVVRGLHAQWNPHQGKLIRTISGRLIDLALDIRKGSPTFGKIVAREMRSADADGRDEWIWIPPGFAHGTVFTEDTRIEYLCTSAWSPGCEVSIAIADGGIDWSLADPRLVAEVRAVNGGERLVTEKDRDGLTLEEWSAQGDSDRFVYSPGRPFDLTSRM